MGGLLASWVGEHSKLGPTGCAVVKEYALAADLWGNPVAEIKREDVERRTRYGKTAVIKARAEAIASKELEELERPGGRGKGGRYRVVVVLCPEERACRSCELVRRERVRQADRFARADKADADSGRRPKRVRQADRLRDRRPVDNSKQTEPKGSASRTVSAGKGPPDGPKGPLGEPLRIRNKRYGEPYPSQGGTVPPGESDDRAAPPPSPQAASAPRSGDDEPTALAGALDAAVPGVPPPAVRALREQIETASRRRKVEQALSRPLSGRRSRSGDPDVSGDLNAASGAPGPAERPARGAS